MATAQQYSRIPKKITAKQILAENPEFGCIQTVYNYMDDGVFGRTTFSERPGCKRGLRAVFHEDYIKWFNSTLDNKKRN